MKNSLILMVGFSLVCSLAHGHGIGRLFDIQVVEGKLVAQGYNTGSGDGLAAIRPYTNSIHDHFNFIGSESQPLGVTAYPSWDIGVLEGADVSALIGYDLRIELVGSGKWVNVPQQDGSGLAQDFGTPQLFGMSQVYLQSNPSDVIRVKYDGNTIDTAGLGEFLLAASVTGVTPDLDFEYFIDNHNSSEIYYVEFKLKTNAPGVADSDSIYVIQSPDGVGPVERLHFQSLYLESYLGRTSEPIVLGDVNRDGQVSLLDVQPLVAVINGGGYQVEADVNQDGAVDLQDVKPFVDLLLSN